MNRIEDGSRMQLGGCAREVLVAACVLAASGCAGATPTHVIEHACAMGSAPDAPASATRRVSIRGEAADTIADTQDERSDGHIRIHTHDGRDLWVPEGAVTPAAIEVDAWVFLALGPEIVPGRIVRVLDDFVEVQVDEDMVGVVPMEAVVAVLHERPAELLPRWLARGL